MPEFDQETQTFNPEYQKLEEDIQEKQQAIDTSSELLAKAGKTQELDMMNRQPEKIEETLNKKFAESQLDRANNLLDNALEEDGSVKKGWFDKENRSINGAILQVMHMRNAIEDRLKDGDLKGQDSAYQYLIDKADQVLDGLMALRDASSVNQANRDSIQQHIAYKQAGANLSGIGFSMEDGEITNQPLYTIADQVLEGKLPDLLKQVLDLPG